MCAGRQRHCPMVGERCLKHVELDYTAKVQELGHECTEQPSTLTAMHLITTSLVPDLGG